MFGVKYEVIFVSSKVKCLGLGLFFIGFIKTDKLQDKV